MNRRLVALLVIAACKASHSDDTRSGSASGPAPSAPRGIEKLSPSEGDGAQAAAIATRYMHAMGTRDWSAACATRPKHERDEMARIAGSCEKAFAAIAEKQPVEIMAHVAPTAVRHRGEQWAVDMNQPGQGRPVATLIVTKENESWVVVDVPDDQEF